MSHGSSPALILRFAPDTPTAARDRLVALLADYDLVAIHEDDLTAPRTWTAHFGSPGARDAAAAAIGGLTDIAQPGLEPTDVEDGDWARRTQADLPAIRVGRVVVAPPWDLPVLKQRAVGEHPSEAPSRRLHDLAPDQPPPRLRRSAEALRAQAEGESRKNDFFTGASGGSGRLDSPSASVPPSDVIVEIEPSRGFGTGHHQSTRLCLVLLQSRDLTDRTVIDVGTGSGVLAIVAARLGAAFVAAIDSDPEAVENARENIERNAVAGVVEAHLGDLTETPLAPADVVVANLTGTLLARHASPLGAIVKPSGSLIVAGFTIDEKALVRDAFTGAFDVIESAEEDDWWAFVLTRV